MQQGLEYVIQPPALGQVPADQPQESEIVHYRLVDHGLAPAGVVGRGAGVFSLVDNTCLGLGRALGAADAGCWDDVPIM